MDPPILIEDDNDDEDDDDDENASQASEDSDGDVIFIGENATNEVPEPEQTFNDKDTEELNAADEEQLGRGRRKKKKTERLVEDATWGQNHAGLHEEVKLNIPTPKCKKKNRMERR